MWAVFGYAYDAEAIVMMPPAACSCSVAFLTAYKFTGKERDTESGLDYFGARFNASTMGRFKSPDRKKPSLKHLVSPQNWNK
jgi:RHS repeat-associated protein